MGYVEKSSTENEEVRYRIGVHGGLKLLAGLATVILIAASVFTFGITLVLIPFLWVPLLTVDRAVTSRRVVRKVGFFSVNTEEMQLDAIETVEFDQSLLGRIFRYATISVTGRGVSDIVMKIVPHPFDAKKAIELVQKDVEEGKPQIADGGSTEESKN